MGHTYSATRPRMCAAIIRLPFLADDLFVNFDDERSEAGVRVLAELAKSTQVLFFTHHPTSRRSRVRQLVLTLSQSAPWLEIGKESDECRFSARAALQRMDRERQKCPRSGHSPDMNVGRLLTVRFTPANGGFVGDSTRLYKQKYARAEIDQIESRGIPKRLIL